jgi:hypothetical protein
MRAVTSGGTKLPRVAVETSAGVIGAPADCGAVHVPEGASGADFTPPIVAGGAHPARAAANAAQNSLGQPAPARGVKAKCCEIIRGEAGGRRSGYCVAPRSRKYKSKVLEITHPIGIALPVSNVTND